MADPQAEPRPISPVMTLLPSPVRPPAGSSTPPIRFALERAEDRAAVDALIDRAFGPGRFAKTAERLREGARLRDDLSVCVWIDEALAGAVRLWPAHIGRRPVLFLGPIAVEREMRRHGVGAALVEQACRRAEAAGDDLVILVGDLGFFGPLGFEAVPAGRVSLPGPLDPRRLLWSALRPGGLEGVGGRLSVDPAA